MVAQDYLDNISANMIDYADSNTSPTVGASPKTYRGIDNWSVPHGVLR